MLKPTWPLVIYMEMFEYDLRGFMALYCAALRAPVKREDQKESDAAKVALM